MLVRLFTLSGTHAAEEAGVTLRWWNWDSETKHSAPGSRLTRGGPYQVCMAAHLAVVHQRRTSPGVRGCTSGFVAFGSSLGCQLVLWESDTPVQQLALCHWAWGRILFPEANNQSGSQIINLSPLEGLCSWDGLQMGHEKALGKLQKEITLQNEKRMHIYQPGAAEEQAPSIWGHHRAPPQGVRATTSAVAFLDSNLPKPMLFPDFLLPRSFRLFRVLAYLFVSGYSFNNGEICQGCPSRRFQCALTKL